MISHRLLLTLLSPARRQGRQGGFSLLSGLVVILVLITGSLALVSVTTGDLLGSGRRSTSRDAFATAEAGADLIIASLNQPENRRLLVAGQPLSAWASSGANPALRSPYTLPDGSGPGADGTGQPSQQATRFATGTFQPLDDAGTRQFRLVEVTYSAGNPGQSDRRTHSFTTRSDGSTSAVGSFNSTLINLDNPKGEGLLPL
ncbi:MAG: hypothetical protein ACKO25_07315 [Cyanobium sp.]